MHKGFYLYLSMLVFAVFAFGVIIGRAIAGDKSITGTDVFGFLFWSAGALWVVIDEYKLKEAYTAAEKELA